MELSLKTSIDNVSIDFILRILLTLLNVVKINTQNFLPEFTGLEYKAYCPRGQYLGILTALKTTNVCHVVYGPKNKLSRIIKGYYYNAVNFNVGVYSWLQCYFVTFNI